MNRRLLLAAALPVLLLGAGCRHCCKKDDCCGGGPSMPPFRPAGPAGTSPYLLPPAGLPTAPAPGGSAIVPGVGPADLRNYPPPPGAIGPPVKPGPEILTPDPIPGTSSSRSALPGFLNDVPPAKRPTAEPPVASDPVTAGLPGFTKVQDGLASGRKPSLDGFESLRQAGYRTVIYLHPAGADVSAAKEVAEKRGLKFVPIETTPEKLGEAVEQFNAAVADKANRPAYVCDDDGVRAGAVWYLHFRTAEAAGDDVARVRAKALGLSDQGDEAKAFALATQRYLETR